MNVQEVVAAYSKFLGDLGIRHVLGGSLASSAWGEQRFTNDADFLIEFSDKKVTEFLEKLPQGFMADEVTMRQAIAETEPFASFQVHCIESAFRFDNFIANSLWDAQQLERARLLPLTEGVRVPVSSPEDMIIAKCRWFDLGKRISDRQWHDLVRLYEVQCENLERPYIEKWLAHFGLLDLWEEIQRQSTM